MIQKFEFEFAPGYDIAEWEKKLEDNFIYVKGELPVRVKVRWWTWWIGHFQHVMLSSCKFNFVQYIQCDETEWTEYINQCIAKIYKEIVCLGRCFGWCWRIPEVFTSSCRQVFNACLSNPARRSKLVNDTYSPSRKHPYRSVSSNCALGLPSTVTAVQLSGQCSSPCFFVKLIICSQLATWAQAQVRSDTYWLDGEHLK